jgi:hypothetical protein
MADPSTTALSAGDAGETANAIKASGVLVRVKPAGAETVRAASIRIPA